jgi:hypothetical protein
MTAGKPGDRAGWLMPGLVGACVLVAQLWLVAAVGTDIPFQDQWDAEGRGLYPGVRDGTASLATLFQPHNEHRIAWTQGLNWLLFSANGQWDPLVQLTAGAGLHALGAALLVALLARGLPLRGRLLMGAAVVLFNLPLAGWHNALWGFQTQVYFALLFAVMAFALWSAPVVSRGRLAAGGLAGAAALVAMGPGMLVPAGLAAGWLAAVRERGLRWRELAVAVALGLLAGWLYRAEPAHAALRAHTPGEFFAALGRLLAWPYSDQPWAALVLNLPLAGALAGRLSGRRPAAAGEDFVMMLAAWTLLVAAGAAWSRGGSAEFAAGVPSRYVDFVLLLPLVNAWCVLQQVWRARALGVLAAAAWGICVVAGWLGLSAGVVRGIVAPRLADRDAPVRLVQEFQRTARPGVFAGQPRLLVPHPDPAVVQAVLADPRLKDALPPSLQPERPMGPLSRGVRQVLGR